MIRKASVVGLGKLGLCLAAVLAQRGFDVVGVDIDKSKVDALNGGKCPIYEPKLPETLRACRQRLSGTNDYVEAVTRSNMTFVVVPTPSDSSGAFSLRFVRPVMKEIGKAIKKKCLRHSVFLTSTVMPGSMEGYVLPELESASGLKCPDDFGLCYNPEFIALGDVINGLLRPDMILIGESDSVAGDELEEVQKRVCLNSPPFARMNFVNAELAKISVNSYVTMKMSFANTLAEICERLSGADVDRVTQAIGNDRRIGKMYLKGGVGYGGPCFPRDNIAFAKLAKLLGTDAPIATTTDKVNQRQVERLLDLARRAGLRRGMDVSILGLSYKPNTNVVDESQGVMLCETLTKKGFRVHAYDPAAMENARNVLLDKISFHESSSKAVTSSDVCFVVTPWEEFMKLDPKVFAGKILIDCWRVLPNAKEKAREYVAIGRFNRRIAKPVGPRWN